MKNNELAPDGVLKLSSLESNTITFKTNDYLEIIKLCDNGDIFVKGNLVENDKEVVVALREFITIINSNEDSRVLAKKLYLDSGIDNNAYNWHIWKRAFDLGRIYSGKVKQ